MSKIYITKYDHERLMGLLRKKRLLDVFDKALLVELRRAKIVEPEDIPEDAITMNSHVRFIDEYNLPWDYWLVFPEDSDWKGDKISILSPVGCALIGSKVGDTVTVTIPRQGRRKLIVREVLWQPEREGNFAL